MNNKKIIFNIHPHERLRGGSNIDNKGNKLFLSAIEDIDVEKIDMNHAPLFQVFSTPYRVNNENIKWEDWNGCICVDIDSKKYAKANNIEQFKAGFENMTIDVYNFLANCCNSNFFFYQISASGMGYHFVFYFDVNKNIENYKKCANYSLSCVKAAFTEKGYGDIINFPDVVDEVSKRYTQLFKITNNKIYYNFTCIDFEHGGKLANYPTGKINDKVLDKFDEEDIEYNENDISFDTKYANKFKLKDNSILDWSHINRWRLILVLSRSTNGDINKARKLYEQVVDEVILNSPTHTHSKNELMRLFEQQFKQTTNSSVKYTMSSSMLKWCKSNLGIKFKITFKPAKTLEINYDKVYNLKEDETISNIIEQLYNSKHKLIHITAGCGLGKTYAAKTLANKDIDIFDALFSGTSKFNIRICFVTPMTSISRGNFEDKDSAKKWKIIDAEHEEYDKSNVLRSTDYCVCTTWTSFINYKMYDNNFDLYVFDEIHTLYLYDYRTEIKYIKSAINKLRQHDKVFMMTGTPSYEIEEFDCYKVKVNKEVAHVNCDIVFYNDQYKGYIFNDLKSWLEQDKINNGAIIFYDKANERTKDAIETYYGIKVDMFYSSKFRGDVSYINDNKSFKGNVLLCSVYGQAGINIYASEKQRLRLYILNDCGMSVIQYFNRLRNKEHVDKIIIPYKNENIKNCLLPINTNFEEEKQITLKNIENKNKYNTDNKIEEEIFTGKTKRLIRLNFGLNNYYLDGTTNGYGTTYILDDFAFNDYMLIKRTIEYERNIQQLYNRLIEASVDVNFIYLDEDVIDIADKTKRLKNRFAGHMLNFDWSCTSKNYNNEIYIDTRLSEMNKTMSDSDKEHLTYVFNTLYKKYGDEWKERFKKMVDFCFSENETFTKTNLKQIAKIYEINENMDKYKDNYYITRLLEDPNTDIERLTAMYVAMLADEIPNEDILVKQVAPEVYGEFKEYKKMVDNYKWLVEKVNEDDTQNYINNGATIEQRKIIYSKVLGYLNDQHTPKNKDNSDKCKKIEVDGVIYDSIKDCCDKTGKSRKTIHKWLKEGKYHYV